MPDTHIAVAQALLEIGAVRFTPEAPITFKSGIKSPVYVDNRRLPYWPAQWEIIIGAFQEFISEKQIQFDIIAGIETAGIPHSTALAYTLKRPSVFIRKQTKEHGTKSRIEGGDVGAKRVLLIEDLVTTGGSSLAGIEALRDAHAITNDCMAIVSYGFKEASIAFEVALVTLHTLTDFATITHAALESGRFSTQEIDIIKDWLRDPYGWAARHGHNE